MRISDDKYLSKAVCTIRPASIARTHTHTLLVVSVGHMEGVEEVVECLVRIEEVCEGHVLGLCGKNQHQVLHDRLVSAVRVPAQPRKLPIVPQLAHEPVHEVTPLRPLSSSPVQHGRHRKV